MDRQRSQFPLIAEGDGDGSPPGSPGLMYDAEAARAPTYWTPPATQLSLNPLYGDDFALPPSVPARASTQDNHDEEDGNDLFEPTLAEKQAAAAAAAARGAGKQPATKREGMRITIRDLTYSVKAKQKRHISLLTSVSAYIAPGLMTALMGPSGSGKTTLLDVLAGRKTAGEVKGTVLYAGRPATHQFLRRFTGYVEQFDTLLENLTVGEMLLYTAELKISLQHSLAAKRERVASILQQLALTPCRDVKIGGAMNKGISGGQAKRVNIGIALVTNPRVLFLDEPTSGLDSFTSQQVMQVVKALTQGADPITVCATIHSPSAYTFKLFDRLLILLRGRLTYFGAIGSEAVEYFEAQFPELPRFSEEGGANLAEWLVNITTQADQAGQADRFAAAYKASQLKQDNEDSLTGSIPALGRGARTSVATLRELQVRNDTVTPFWHQYTVLIKYRLTANYKDANFISTRVSDKVVITALMMLLYWGKGDDLRVTNLLNVSTLLYIWAMLPAFSAAAYVPTLVMERPLFTRERADGLYAVITYLCAKLTEEIGLAFIMSIIFSLAVFYSVQFLGQWIFFWLIYFTTMCIGIILAYAVAAASTDLATANTTVPAYVMTLLFFTGCLLRIPDIPGYARWYSYLNFIRFSWGAVMVNQFAESKPEFLPGYTILEYYSFDKVNKWAYWGYELCFCAFFFFLAWLALAYKQHQKR